MRINNKRTKTPENELKEMEISNKILSGLEYNIEEFTTERTGRGVRATTLIKKNSYVCEYKGALLKEKELKRLQTHYDANPSVGSYVVYLNSLADPYKVVDATQEDGSLGRICNHSAKNANCELKLIKFINIERYGDSEKRPHLYLKTIKDVAKGEELVWNYGETRKSITDSNPWLKF